MAQRPGRRCEPPSPLEAPAGELRGQSEGEGPLGHTLQCVVLTGIPIFEANTTVSAEASSIVNPLWKEGGETFFTVMCGMVQLEAEPHQLPHHKAHFNISYIFTHHTVKQ
ncbi:hypothetical protein AMECASPLE_017361 [Ameca splendens]|uniref:Uncharacterized protein n=1 Tax=Ameca splendens TaxID=208324 RepID=A0ABV0ZZ75_9TELE